MLICCLFLIGSIRKISCAYINSSNLISFCWYLIFNKYVYSFAVLVFINDLKMQGSNAVAESTDHKAGTEASTDGLCEARQEALDVDEGRASGVTGFVADKVKDGARKAAETAENVGDTARQTMDGAWKAAKETTEKIKDKVICGDDGDRDHIDRDPSVFDAKKTSDPIDTQEYRSIEDQRNKAVLKKKKKTLQ